MFSSRAMWLLTLVPALLVAGCTGTDSSQFKTLSQLEDSQSADAPLTPELAPEVQNPLPSSPPAAEVKPAETILPVAAVANSQPAAPEATENGPREIKLLIAEKSFFKDRKNNALRMTFDDIDLLKILNMDPVVPNAAEYLPAWLKKLDGQRVMLRGWMYPIESPKGIQKFLFTRDNGTCCFGPNAKIYDKIWVELRDGDAVNYIDQRPFDVVGRMGIEPYINGQGDLELLYTIKDAQAIVK